MEDEAKARDGLADRKADVKQLWLKPFPDNESLGRQITSDFTESVQMTRILNSAKTATCSHLLPAATCSHLQPLAASCSHLQPLAATCSHLQPLGPIPTSSFSPENLQHSPAENTGEFSTFSGGSKWLQVSAGSKWLRVAAQVAAQVAASGCKWLQVAAVGCSGCKWLLGASGCKWQQVAAQVAASGCKWLQVAASGCKGAFWKQISAILRPLGQLLNFSSGIIGKRPFLAKSWPGAFWKQISAIWWLLGASGCKWLQVAAGSK